MKYFTKTAVGPVIHNTNMPGGFFLSPENYKKAKNIPFFDMLIGEIKNKNKVLKKGLIVVGKPFENFVPRTLVSKMFRNLTPEKIKTHELTHWLRHKKGKWSARNYGKNPLATFIDEFAAYKRSGTKVSRAAQAGLWNAASKANLPRLAKFITKI